jgi:prepilin-type N-terminal cleavage/methylation domain-containing protein
MKIMLRLKRKFFSPKKQTVLAFTFIELLLVLAIVAVLTSIASITLSNLVPKANLFTTTDVLLAEIRHQQLRSMNREKNSDELASEYGVHIQQHQYTLFSGNVYDADDPENLVTEVEAPLELATNFPDQSIIFAQGSGEIENFAENFNEINVVDTSTGQIETITFNPYGVPE